MRKAERQRKGTGGDREREREIENEGKRQRGTDSWLHHISLAVVECALTVRVASVVVQYR